MKYRNDIIFNYTSTSGTNLKVIAHAIGLLLLFEALPLLICSIVSLCYKENDFMSFIATFVTCVITGCAMLAYGHQKELKINRKESYIVVAFSWVFFTVIGMLPFLIGGYIPSVTDAFFETMSGFTTTGATILDNIDTMPHAILLWRSVTQWIGGLGIVCFIIVLLPGFGSNSQMLFLSEATGVTHDKIHPKVRVMARYILIVYFLLTAIETVLLMTGGMSLFDAICHSMATTATGGFSTRQDSIAYWNSPFIEYTVSVFMLLSAINFSLYIAAIKGKGRMLFHNVEVRWFLSSLFLLTVVITLTLTFNKGYGVEEAFRKALFQVVTCHTSCGFATDEIGAVEQRLHLSAHLKIINRSGEGDDVCIVYILGDGVHIVLYDAFPRFLTREATAAEPYILSPQCNFLHFVACFLCATHEFLCKSILVALLSQAR